MQELLRIAAQHKMKPAYVKYSHASYLHPMLQPAEYQTFPSEVGVLRKHVGHVGNGGSAYQLGDSLYGLQWNVFVASELSFVPTLGCRSDCGMAVATPDEDSGHECPGYKAHDNPTGAFLLPCLLRARAIVPWYIYTPVHARQRCSQHPLESLVCSRSGSFCCEGP